MRSRSVAEIKNHLHSALAFQRRRQESQAVPSTDPYTVWMHAADEEEIGQLTSELSVAESGEFELVLNGSPVTDHRITVPYVTRVLGAVQSTYKSLAKAIAPEGRLPSHQAALTLSATAPGSFRILLKLPDSQLDLLEEPISDRAIEQVVILLDESAQGHAATMVAAWAERASESSVRAMIRLSSSLASSRGTTEVRWRAVSGNERRVTLSANSARDLSVALAGQAGQEVIEVTGHLTMASDEPPRVLIKTPDDEHRAVVNDDDLLERVRELIFEDVAATLMVDMRTSPTTGSPSTEKELLDLRSVNEE